MARLDDHRQCARRERCAAAVRVEEDGARCTSEFNAGHESLGQGVAPFQPCADHGRQHIRRVGLAAATTCNG